MFTYEELVLIILGGLYLKQRFNKLIDAASGVRKVIVFFDLNEIISKIMKIFFVLNITKFRFSFFCHFAS